MLNIYITTDTHFRHNNVIKYCGRPENYESELWANLYDIPKEDILIHLGDICMKSVAETHKFIKEMPCRKFLVKGNHDNKSTNWYLSNGWDFVCDSFSMMYDNCMIYFSHQPITLHKETDINIHGHFHNALPKLLKGELLEGESGRKNIKNLKKITPRHINISCEEDNYKPVLLQTVLKRCKTIEHQR